MALFPSLRVTLRVLRTASALAVVAGAAACQSGSPEEPSQTASTTSALTPSQQCLRQASDADIIAELQARLQASGSSGGTSGGTTTGGGAVASYNCDSSAQVNVSVVGPSGAEKTAKVYIGDPNRCQTVIALLNRNRRSIQQTTMIGICDNSAQINRFSMTPDGDLQTLSKVYVGDPDACTTQANALDN